MDHSDASNMDLHIHTEFSDGNCSVEDVVREAKIKGLNFVAITDHYSEFSALPNRMSKRNLPKYLDTLENFNIIKGVEVDIFDDGKVSISEETANRFDMIIGGLHSVLGIGFWHDTDLVLDQRKYLEVIRVALIKAFESKKLNIIAHITRLPESLQPEYPNIFSDNWVRSVVKAACDNNVTVELSGAWKVPDERFVTECIKQGVKLSLGSDAHNLKTIGDTTYGLEMLKRLNIGKDSIYLPKKG